MSGGSIVGRKGGQKKRMDRKSSKEGNKVKGREVTERNAGSG